MAKEYYRYGGKLYEYGNDNIAMLNPNKTTSTENIKNGSVFGYVTVWGEVWGLDL